MTSQSLRRIYAVLLFFSVDVTASECPKVEIDASKRPLFLQFNNEFTSNYNYAYIEDIQTIRHKLKAKDGGYEIDQEQGKLFLVLSEKPINELSAFIISDDERGADFKHHGIPRSLEPVKLKDLNKHICVLTL